MENVGEISAVKEQSQSKLPKIEYDKSLLNPECPYKVNVDQQECAKLLEFAGVERNKIDNITVKLRRKPGSILTKLNLADYNPRTNNIRIYTDYLWKDQEKLVKKADKILRKVEENPAEQLSTGDKNSFPELASGKKLSWYLTIAPPERARKTVEKLAEMSIAKEADATLNHEAKHAGDFSKDRWLRVKNFALAIATFEASNLGTDFLLKHTNPYAPPIARAIDASIAGTFWGATAYYYFISPVERSARKFAKEMENSPRFKIITISPKQ